MDKVRDVFKSHGGEMYIIVRIGNYDLKIPESNCGYLVRGKKYPTLFESVLIRIPSLNYIEVYTLGDEIHDNKLEVLKSEFDYELNES